MAKTPTETLNPTETLTAELTKRNDALIQKLCGTRIHLQGQPEDVSSIDLKNRSMTIVALTSRDIKSFNWSVGPHMLSAQMDGVNMERANSSNPRAPFLYAHDDDENIGEILSTWVEGEELRMRVRFHPEGLSQKGDEQFGRIAAGARPAFSLGLSVDKAYIDPDTRNDDYPRLIAEEFTPWEVSICSMGRCPDARILSGDDQSTSNAQPTDSTMTGNPDLTKLSQEELNRAAAAAVQEQLKLESERQSAITQVAQQYQLTPDERQEMLDSGVQGDAIYKMAHEKSMARNQALVSSAGGHPVSVVSLGAEPLDHVADGAAAWLDAKCDNRQYDKDVMSGPARMFATHGKFVDLARAFLQARNEDTKRMDDMMLLSGAITSSDFPKLLANVINKRLLPMYETDPLNFMDFTTIGSPATDFKEIEVDSLDGRMKWYKVPENFEDVPVSELAEENLRYTVDEYATSFRVSYRTLVNDDLNAIMRNIRSIGPSVVAQQNRTVWELFLSNPMMGDGERLFSADHANISTRTRSNQEGIVSADALLEAQNAFDLRTDRMGDDIAPIEPRYLFAPPAIINQLRLELGRARRGTIAAEDLGLATVLEGIELRKIKELRNPRIPGRSETRWFLTSGLQGMVNAEISYLFGRNVPLIRMEEHFANRGLRFAGNMYYGVAFLEWRNWWRNDGT